MAFALLALVAELAGRVLTVWIDVGRHVRSPASAGADYYPFLLAFVKLGLALLLARLAWRLARARALALAAERALGTARPVALPRPSFRLSPRLWAAFFAVTSLFYLVQTDVEHAAAGRWHLLGPWLHSSALPVFAVLAVVLAVVWQLVQGSLADYERYAESVAEHARQALTPPKAAPAYGLLALPAPRRLFGLAFEVRPPPLPA